MKIRYLLSTTAGLIITANANALVFVDDDGFKYEVGEVIEQPNPFPFETSHSTKHYQITCTAEGNAGSADCRMLLEPDTGAISLTTVENDTYFAWSCLGNWDGQGFDAICVSNGGETWNDRYSIKHSSPFTRNSVTITDPRIEK
jgi:hypothetical protein